jgi:hypothetical protein
MPFHLLSGGGIKERTNAEPVLVGGTYGEPAGAMRERLKETLVAGAVDINTKWADTSLARFKELGQDCEFRAGER